MSAMSIKMNHPRRWRPQEDRARKRERASSCLISADKRVEKRVRNEVFGLGGLPKRAMTSPSTWRWDSTEMVKGVDG